MIPKSQLRLKQLVKDHKTRGKTEMRTLVSSHLTMGDTKQRDPESSLGALGAKGTSCQCSRHSRALGSQQQEMDNEPLIIQAAAFLLSWEQTLPNKK